MTMSQAPRALTREIYAPKVSISLERKVPAKVVIVACMRTILVCINAMMKNSAQRAPKQLACEHGCLRDKEQGGKSKVSIFPARVRVQPIQNRRLATRP